MDLEEVAEAVAGDTVVEEGSREEEVMWVEDSLGEVTMVGVGGLVEVVITGGVEGALAVVAVGDPTAGEDTRHASATNGC